MDSRNDEVRNKALVQLRSVDLLITISKEYANLDVFLITQTERGLVNMKLVSGIISKIPVQEMNMKFQLSQDLTARENEGDVGVNQQPSSCIQKYQTQSMSIRM